jgi:uncharacterized protein YqgV (UPF0045/DUF77 family)
MIVSAQISLYPPRQERLSPAIHELQMALAADGPKVMPGPMSTLVTEEASVLFDALKEAFDRAAATGHVVAVSYDCIVPTVPYIFPEHAASDCVRGHLSICMNLFRRFWTETGSVKPSRAEIAMNASTSGGGHLPDGGRGGLDVPQPDSRSGAILHGAAAREGARGSEFIAHNAQGDG